MSNGPHDPYTQHSRITLEEAKAAGDVDAVEIMARMGLEYIVAYALEVQP